MKHLQIKMSDQQMNLLKHVAEKKKISVSKLVSDALYDYTVNATDRNNDKIVKNKTDLEDLVNDKKEKIKAKDISSSYRSKLY